MKNSLTLLIFILTMISGTCFAQDVQEKIEYSNLVKNGDFESGALGFKSDYKYADKYSGWGFYIITDNAAQSLGGGVFLNPIPNTGKYYFIDMNNSGKQRLWYDSVNVKPNTTYSFSCFGANVCTDFPAPGVMNLKVNGKQICPSQTLSNQSPAWMPLSVKYKTGPKETSIEISIVDEIYTLMGNDVALDNIVFKEISPEEFTSSCGVTFVNPPERPRPNKRYTLDRKTAEEELNSALTDTTQYNVIKDPNFTILDSEEKAIKFAETILFDRYGKEQIERIRPYQIYNIDNYWIISGTPPCPDGLTCFGGTVLIIFNALDGKVIRRTQWK